MTKKNQNIATELLTNNTIIAKYVGFVFYEKGTHIFPDGYWFHKKHRTVGKNELQFHSSFDALNPVAKRVREKLEKIAFKADLKTQKTLYHTACSYRNSIDGAAKTFEISQLFSVVVKAIEFLNSTKKRKNNTSAKFYR